MATPHARPHLQADFDLPFILTALEQGGFITAVQRAELLLKETSTRARLMREHGPRPQAPGTLEVVAAFGLPVPGKQGQLVDEEVLAEVASKAAGLGYRRIDPLKLDMQLITKLLSRPYAERHAILPLEMLDGKLVVAVANPFDREAIEAVRQLAMTQVVPVLASRPEILRSIEHVYGFKRSIASVADGGFSGGQLGDFEQLVRISGDKELDANDRPVVAAVDHLLKYAFDQRASDIHLEPRRNASDVRLRIDGVLHRVYTLPRQVHAPLLSRLKMLARMDIAEKRRPQDGRIKTERAGREVELRISTVPTAFGEKGVLRIFDPEAIAPDLASLGFFPDEQRVFEDWVARPHGMILVTGPTGSGKTTTLYSTLRTIATPDVNVTTIEDPIEMVFEGLNQIQVQPKIDLDFAGAIRHILRQDPDIVMVGEIRDTETAHAAVQAALTGHLVMSTLHTNTAIEAIVRLVDLGVEPFLIASSLVGVMAQRLVRSVCGYCAEEKPLTVAELESLGVPLPEDAMPRKGAGCPKCRLTGYLGRSAIFELRSITHELGSMVSLRKSAAELEARAREVQKMPTLRESGARKVALGLTTVEEVVRVTSM